VDNGVSPFNFSERQNILNQGNSSIGDSLPVVLDSLAPYLHLPQSTCDAIASYLPVTYQKRYKLYFWDTEKPDYEKIITSPSYLSLTFRTSGLEQANLTIKVPFSLLNLTLQAPIIVSPTQFFPCRPPLAGGVYTLGRAFLQAAFMGVHYDGHSGSWFFAQAPGPNIPKEPQEEAFTTSIDSSKSGTWSDTWAGHWTPIKETTLKTNTTSGGAAASTSAPKDGLSIVAKAGIGVGCTAAVTLAAGIILCLYRSRFGSKQAADANDTDDHGLQTPGITPPVEAADPEPVELVEREPFQELPMTPLVEAADPEPGSLWPRSRQSSSLHPPAGEPNQPASAAAETPRTRFRNLIRHPDYVYDTEKFPGVPWASLPLQPATPLEQRPGFQSNPANGPRDPNLSATTPSDPDVAPAHLRMPGDRFAISPDTPFTPNTTGDPIVEPSPRQLLTEPELGRTDPTTHPRRSNRRIAFPRGDMSANPFHDSPLRSAPPDTPVTSSPTQQPLDRPKAPPFAFGLDMLDREVPPIKPEYHDAIFRPGMENPNPPKSYQQRSSAPIPRDEFNEYKSKMESILEQARANGLKSFQRLASQRREDAQQITALKDQLKQAQTNQLHSSASLWSRPRSRGPPQVPEPISDKILAWKKAQIDAGNIPRHNTDSENADDDDDDDDGPPPPYSLLTRNEPPLYLNLPDKLRQLTVDLYLLR
ncbi:MAG: hypothetical protein Q9181_008037, partial [Wetmoreana brouardii]